MCNRTCYLHIGLRKTGWRFLQRFIANNVDQLSESGIYIPKTGFSDEQGHHHLLAQKAAVNNVFDTQSKLYQALWDELRETDGQNILISSELFGDAWLMFNRKRIRQLIVFFRSLRMKLHVIAYVPPQIPVLNFVYAQHVWQQNMKGRVGSFEQIWAEKYGSRFDYLSLFESWLGLCNEGECFVDVRPYNQRLTEDQIEVDFLNQLEVGLSNSLRIPPRFDPMPSAMTLEGRRWMNQCLAEIGKKQSAVAFKSFAGKARKQGWNRGSFQGFSAEVQQKIVNRYADSNEEFAQKMWGKGWYEVFPEEKDRVYKENAFVYEEARPKQKIQFLETIIKALANSGELP